MYDNIKEEFRDLEKQLSDPALTSDIKKLTDISRRHAELKDVYGLILELEKTADNIAQNEDILKNEADEELKNMAREELTELEKTYEKLKTELEKELNPDDPRDKKNVIMEIRAGTGGDESALFAAELFRMYARFIELNRPRRF